MRDSAQAGTKEARHDLFIPPNVTGRAHLAAAQRPDATEGSKTPAHLASCCEARVKSHSAIDKDAGSGDVVRVVGSKEGGNAADLFRLADAPVRD